MTATIAAKPNEGSAGTNRGQRADSPTQIPAKGWKEILLRTWRESSKDNVSIVAAGVAFYGFLALVPLLAAVVLTYGFIAEPQTVVEHARSLTKILPTDIAKLVAEQLMNVVRTSGDKKGFGLVVALAVALWGAHNAATSLITALNIAYEEEEKRSFIRVTLLALLMTVGAVALALLAGVAVGVLASLQDMLPGLGPVGTVIGKVLTYVFLGAVAAAAAATVYRYGPSRDKARWTWITPGSVFFAVVWIIMTAGFGFYVSQFGNYGATYGSLSAVVVLLTWLYLSSYVLLLGAELNSEIEHQTAKDTTAGAQRPLGARGAWSADHVAAGSTETNEEKESAAAPPAQQTSDRPLQQPKTHAVQAEHPYLVARATNRAASVAGLQKVGMISAALSTMGLSLLRRRGREAAGAALLATAAGLSLLQRED